MKVCKLIEILRKCGEDVKRLFQILKRRFGFDYLQRYFSSHGVRIEVVEETEKNYFEELVEDFVSIIISFAARIYGKRSQKFRKVKEPQEVAETERDLHGYSKRSFGDDYRKQC